jgi:hypothetical protein
VNEGGIIFPRGQISTQGANHVVKNRPPEQVDQISFWTNRPKCH